MPADGVVAEVYSSIDESMLTGEALPVEKAVGAPAVGATINRSGINQRTNHFRLRLLEGNTEQQALVSVADRVFAEFRAGL